jgi:hypothetical protein
LAQAREKGVKIIDEDGLASLIRAAPAPAGDDDVIAMDDDAADGGVPSSSPPTAAQLLARSPPAAAQRASAGAPSQQQHPRSQPAGPSGRHLPSSQAGAPV